MDDTKPWYQSKSLWGAVVAAIAGALGLIAGIDVSAEDMERTVSLVTAAAAAIGGIVAIVGRVMASKKLTKK